MKFLNSALAVLALVAPLRADDCVSTEIDFKKAKLTVNTLHEPGGKLKYEKIGTKGKKQLDLVVSAAKGTSYTTTQPYKNGINGSFGQINIMNKNTAELDGVGTFDFCLVDHDRPNKKVTVDSFHFTFFDVDNRFDVGKLAGLHESVLIDPSQFSTYSVDKKTEIEIECEGGKGKPPNCPKNKRLVFKGTQVGHGPSDPEQNDNPDNPNKLTTLQKRRSVSFTFENTSCFQVTMNLFCPKNNPKKCKKSVGNFLFAGSAKDLTGAECAAVSPSTPSPTPAPFVDMGRIVPDPTPAPKPTGMTTSKASGSGMTTSKASGSDCGVVSTEIDFVNAELTRDSLHEDGGRLRYENIGFKGDQVLDLMVTVADGTTYTTTQPEKNGVNGAFGQINIMNKNTAELDGKGTFDFCLVDHDRPNKKVTVDSFHFTFFDVDNRFDVSGLIGLHESILMAPSEFSSYYVDPNTEIEIECEDGRGTPPNCASRVVFKGTVVGHGPSDPDQNDNPDDPNNLTSLQQQRSISFTFENTSCFQVTMDLYCPVNNPEDCKKSVGNFLFAGSAQDLVEQECEETSPPTKAPTAAPTLDGDTDAPTNNPTPNPTSENGVEICGSSVATDLDFFNADLTVSTLEQPGGKLMFENIGTQFEKSVDMVVTVADGTTYTTTQPEKNGVNGAFGQINIMNKNTAELDGKGTFDFCLVDHDDPSQEITVEEFRFTFFDLDNRFDVNGKTGLHESILIDPSQFSSYIVDGDTEIEIECEDGRGTPPNCDSRVVFKGTVVGHGPSDPDQNDNPDDPNALTTLQIQRSVSFVFKDTSCFQVTMDLFCPEDNGADCKNSVGNFLFAGTAKDLVDIECELSISPTMALSGSPTAAPSSHPSEVPTIAQSGVPTKAPSASPSAAPSSAPSKAPSATPTIAQSGIPTKAPSASPSAAPSSTPSASPSEAPSSPPSNVPSASPSKAPSSTPTIAHSGVPTKAPSASPSAAPSSAPSKAPSATPSVPPSNAPSKAPSAPPSDVPSASPSNAPSSSPTIAHSSGPTESPSATPSEAPSSPPTKAPSAAPSSPPSKAPSASPSHAPSDSPSEPPSAAPSEAPSSPPPSEAPSSPPSEAPSSPPSEAPSYTPTIAHSSSPTETPSVAPSEAPSSPPSKAPSASPSHAPSDSPTEATEAPSDAPSEAPSSPPSATPSHPPSDAPSEPPSAAPSEAPSSPPSMAPSAPPSRAPSASPTEHSESPSAAPSATPSSPPTKAPSASPSQAPTAPPSHAPSDSPTDKPSNAPSEAPTASPSEAPSASPSAPPSNAPSEAPSSPPSEAPSSPPSKAPSASPSHAPSDSPTEATDSPSNAPSEAPSSPPSEAPSASPSAPPSSAPSRAPSSPPSEAPSSAPSKAPSASPSHAPSDSPTEPPSNAPSEAPSSPPSKAPSASPSHAPSDSPTEPPSNAPSEAPSSPPSKSPSASPSHAPSDSPTEPPSHAPSEAPSPSPTENPTDIPTKAPTRLPTKLTPAPIQIAVTPDCSPFVEPELLESIGALCDLPHDAIKVIGSDGHTVQFAVYQLFERDDLLDMLSVEYRDSPLSSDCDTRENVSYAEGELYEAVCFDGHAEFSVYVSVGDGFDADECGKCAAPAEDSTNVHAFHFQIPCVPICHTEVPTQAPSRKVLTAPPTAGPTAGPTQAPTAMKRSEPPICTDDVLLLATIGGTEYPDVPINILEQNGNTVTFEIINPFDDTASIYTQFDQDKDDECMAETDVKPLSDAITYTATCYDAVPLTIVDVYFTDSSAFNWKTDHAEIPECCEAGNDPAVQYTFKLYCESQCGPMRGRFLPEDEMVAINENVQKTYLRSRKDSLF